MFNIYIISSNGYKKHFMECATEEEAREMCEDMNWEHYDDNGYRWRLEIK